MIDIHKYNNRYESLKNSIRDSTTITARNKLLLLKFSADCQTGWGQRKLSVARIIKLLTHLKTLSEMIDMDWDWITQDGVRDILDKIDTDTRKGGWAPFLFS